MDATEIETTETWEERRERLHREEQEKREAALARLLGFCKRTTVDYRSPWRGGLVFDPSGASRLANIAGFIQGLYLAGDVLGPLEQLAATGKGKLTDPKELAIHLAVSINDKLDYLANYGGLQDISVDGGKQTVQVPSYKVVLYDDGTFGGFGVLWCRPVTTEVIQAKAREMDEPAYQGKEEDGSHIPDAECKQRWEEAIDAAMRHFKVQEALEETPIFTPTWVIERREEIEAEHEANHNDTKHVGVYSCPDCPSLSHLGSSREFVRYGFAFNGGLLLHGMGTPTFAVNLTQDKGPGWSIHT